MQNAMTFLLSQVFQTHASYKPIYFSDFHAYIYPRCGAYNCLLLNRWSKSGTHLVKELSSSGGTVNTKLELCVNCVHFGIDLKRRHCTWLRWQFLGLNSTATLSSLCPKANWQNWQNQEIWPMTGEWRLQRSNDQNNKHWGVGGHGHSLIG